MAQGTRPRRRLAPWLLLALFGCSPLWAEQVTLDLPKGPTARADFRSGDTGRAAVLILHGFLQTHEFSTVRSLSEELGYRGYTVLAPTLSFGIDNRQKSLPCNAVHNHTLEDDVGEVGRWVEWLVARGHRQVILVGHSTGSLELLAYTAGQPHPAVTGVVATSLGAIDHWDSGQGDLERARREAAEPGPRLGSYHIAYCRGNYRAPPAAYLSYRRWEKEKVLAAIHASPVPVHVVLGGADERLPESWRRRLDETCASVQVIPGASHFFDATHEFALHDAVADTIREMTGE